MHHPPDRVYTTDDWYDGPRAGAADYRGAPHYYRSLYLDTPKWDPKEDRFELTALSTEALEWAVEADRLFSRWDAARRAGTLPPEATEEALRPDTPLVFPEDRDRYVDLQQKLTAYLAAARTRAFVVRGEFVVGSDSVVWSGPLESESGAPAG